MSDDTAPTHDDDERDLLEVERLLQSLTLDDLATPAPPPPGVWAGIEAAVRADATPGARPGRRPDIDPLTAPSTVPSLAEHRSRRRAATRPFLLAAAAVMIMIAGAVVVVATRGSDGAEVLATAQLTWSTDFDPLGEGASSRAELVRHDGAYQLVIADTALPSDISQVESSADLELWVISTDPTTGDITDVQPVHLLEGSPDGTYAFPSDLDPDTYTVVDISIEPRDGDTAHSGRSILRGQLSA